MMCSIIDDLRFEGEHFLHRTTLVVSSDEVKFGRSEQLLREKVRYDLRKDKQLVEMKVGRNVFLISDH